MSTIITRTVKTEIVTALGIDLKHGNKVISYTVEMPEGLSPRQRETYVKAKAPYNVAVATFHTSEVKEELTAMKLEKWLENCVRIPEGEKVRDYLKKVYADEEVTISGENSAE